MKIFSASQIKKWDQFTIEQKKINSIDLMERASQTCTIELLKQFSNKQFAIFCGPGNNGGDGLAIARQLHLSDKQIIIYTLPSDNYSKDYLINFEKIKELNLNFLTDFQTFIKNITPETIIIDALLGSGINRKVEGLISEIIGFVNQLNNVLISIDLPSGLDTEGSLLYQDSNIIEADFTYSFQNYKMAFLLPESEQYTGEIKLLDIGLSSDFEANTDCNYKITELSDLQSIIKIRNKFSHKGTYGHSLLIAGSKGKMGAAILASRATLRSGTGLLSVYCHEEGCQVLQQTVPEAMTISEEEDVDCEKFSAVGIGPGLGTKLNAANILTQLISIEMKNLVIDADGLNLLSKMHEINFLPKNTILTPHPKEFDRLFGHSKNRIEQIEKAIKFCHEKECYIVLKGAFTAIVCPNGKVFFNPTGNSSMAKGGSGDVLTGILTALLSQGYSSLEACLIGVYLHGLAGDIAKEKQGEISVIASDIVDCIGEAYKSIRL